MQSNVLKGKEWNRYLDSYKVMEKSMLSLYSGITYKYIAIYRVGDFYFCFAFARGYRNISTLKRLISSNL